MKEQNWKVLLKQEFKEPEPFVIDQKEKKEFLKKFFDGEILTLEVSSPNQQDQQNRERFKAQYKKICDEMNKLGFTKFPNLMNQFTMGTSNQVLNNIKDVMESILYVTLVAAPDKRESHIKASMNHEFHCGDGTLTNLQDLYNEITLDKLDINALIGFAKRRKIDDLVSGLYLENTFYNKFQRFQYQDGWEVHDIPNIVNAIAVEMGIKFWTSKDHKDINDNPDTLRANKALFGGYLQSEIENYFSDNKNLNSLVSIVAGRIIENLPKIDSGADGEFVSSYFKRLGIPAAHTMYTECDNTGKPLRYKHNVKDIIKDRVTLYFNEKGILELSNSGKVKRQLKLEDARDSDGIAQEISKEEFPNLSIDDWNYILQNGLRLEKASFGKNNPFEVWLHESKENKVAEFIKEKKKVKGLHPLLALMDYAEPQNPFSEFEKFGCKSDDITDDAELLFDAYRAGRADLASIIVKEYAKSKFGISYLKGLASNDKAVVEYAVEAGDHETVKSILQNKSSNKKFIYNLLSIHTTKEVREVITAHRAIFEEEINRIGIPGLLFTAKAIKAYPFLLETKVIYMDHSNPIGFQGTQRAVKLLDLLFLKEGEKLLQGLIEEAEDDSDFAEKLFLNDASRTVRLFENADKVKVIKILTALKAKKDISALLDNCLAEALRINTFSFAIELIKLGVVVKPEFLFGNDIPEAEVYYESAREAFHKNPQSDFKGLVSHLVGEEDGECVRMAIAEIIFSDSLPANVDMYAIIKEQANYKQVLAKFAAFVIAWDLVSTKLFKKIKEEHPIEDKEFWSAVLKEMEDHKLFISTLKHLKDIGISQSDIFQLVEPNQSFFKADNDWKRCLEIFTEEEVRKKLLAKMEITLQNLDAVCTAFPEQREFLKIKARVLIESDATNVEDLIKAKDSLESLLGVKVFEEFFIKKAFNTKLEPEKCIEYSAYIQTPNNRIEFMQKMENAFILTNPIGYFYWGRTGINYKKVCAASDAVEKIYASYLISDDNNQEHLKALNEAHKLLCNWTIAPALLAFFRENIQKANLEKIELGELKEIYNKFNDKEEFLRDVKRFILGPAITDENLINVIGNLRALNIVSPQINELLTPVRLREFIGWRSDLNELGNICVKLGPNMSEECKMVIKEKVAGIVKGGFCEKYTIIDSPENLKAINEIFLNLFRTDAERVNFFREICSSTRGLLDRDIFDLSNSYDLTRVYKVTTEVINALQDTAHYKEINEIRDDFTTRAWSIMNTAKEGYRACEEGRYLRKSDYLKNLKGKVSNTFYYRCVAAEYKLVETASVCIGIAVAFGLSYKTHKVDLVTNSSFAIAKIIINSDIFKWYTSVAIGTSVIMAGIIIGDSVRPKVFRTCDILPVDKQFESARAA